MFDIHQTIHDGYEDIDEERIAAYIEGLMDEFDASAEAKPVLEQYGHQGYAALMLEYAIGYLGVIPPEMSLRDFNEVLWELFPRKVSTDPDSAAAIVAELRAFWNFLHHQYGLTNAVAIRATLTDAAVKKLHSALANPANYGMAKSFFMLGKQAGFDMTTQEGSDAFMAVYNSSLPRRLPSTPPEIHILPPPLTYEDFPSPLTPKQRAEKRKKRKTQRQARKRNRK
ncbi:MAG: hypothetical protein ACYC3I_24850 [Gemmataceae bacterium]